MPHETAPHGRPQRPTGFTRRVFLGALGWRARGWVAFLLAFLLFTPAARAAVADPAVALRERLARLETRLAEARRRMLDAPLDRAEVELSLGKMALDTAGLLGTMREEPKRIAEWVETARASLDRATLALASSRTAEARGLFIDAGALPRTPAGIRALMESLAAAHFNMVIPEVFRRGYTLYPSRFTERDPEFADVKFDLLGCLVNEAHRVGLEVHPWVWTFRVNSPGYGDPVLSRLPALAARSAKTTEPRFLSPGDPRSRAWVEGLLDEMTDRYDLDGLMLDYVRYDELTPDDWNSQTYWGLDYYARHGVFPTFPIKVGSPEALEYQIWREEQVNTMVRTLSEHLRAKNPNFRLSAATFRGERYARLSKLQNWRHWSNNGWIDFDASMLYTPKTSDLLTWLGWETDAWSRENLLYSILGPLRMDDPLTQTLDQIEALHDHHQTGVLLFSMSHLPAGMIEALGNGPFRRPAMLPHRNPILAARRVLVELDNDYLAGIQLRADPEQAASAAALRTELKKIERSIPLAAAPYWQNGPLIVRLQGLQQTARELARDHRLDPGITDEFGDRVDTAIALTRANAQRLAATRYVPPTLPPLPVNAEPSNEVRD